MRLFLALLSDCRGAAAAEFALVAAIAGAAVTFAALAMNSSITQSLDAPTDCVSGTAQPPADC